MKTIGFLLLGLMLFFFYSDIVMAGLPIDCSGYPSDMCTMVYRPHCGVIHKTYKTYGNKCAFCNAFARTGGRLELVSYRECSKGGKE